MTDPSANPSVSVVIPARNEEARIDSVVRSVLCQERGPSELEVIVVDDGSSDATAEQAERAGARVISSCGDNRGNPAATRNLGAHSSTGDFVVFLDADCMPRAGWLQALLQAHKEGYEAAGGAIACPSGLSLTARCDYYCGWYHVHERRPAGLVSQHPPCNLSVRRKEFEALGGFDETHPIAYAHEELAWQGELLKRGGRIRFVPTAIVEHYNRPGFGNLLRRNYRWGYSALQVKSGSTNTRFSWLYRYPRLLIVASPLLAPLSAVYIVLSWLRASVIMPVWMIPLILPARIAYSVGMSVGGYRWLRGAQSSLPHRPRWE